ncbi:unnamed protein product [Danaus chrysippus]|uniref:(African queen) hypothetical protein n=1 Tax=Danaus chrysippus TaxID=151541 RepID=A0A8J2QKA8_9NEOP|nr:unnamed protein product [Danaus chrysippus]
MDDENEKKYRDTLTALRTTRSLNEEMERLKQENVRLTARRMQVKRQADDVTEALQQARDRRNSLQQETRREEHDTEQIPAMSDASHLVGKKDTLETAACYPETQAKVKSPEARMGENPPCILG